MTWRPLASSAGEHNPASMPLMIKPVLELLEAQRPLVLDRLGSAILANIPRYALVGPADLRERIGRFWDDLLQLIEVQDDRDLNQRLLETAQKRIAQGFSPADYVRALMMVFPIVRGVVREFGPQDDLAFQRGFTELEGHLQGYVAKAAAVYTDQLASQLDARNVELNRLNQQLAARERRLSLEAHQVSTALEQAIEFNRRVIESLSSGVMVVQTGTRKISLFSRRMEEIVGVPADQMLGRDVVEVFSRFEGFDVAAVVQAVQTFGKMPLTRTRITFAPGRSRWVYWSATRLLGPDGQPEGTVVVVDDVTERELLIDSFSRYVSRDLLGKLLARAEAPRLGGERKECTILFADIRGFTSLSERLAPEAVQELLNGYFRVVIAAIARHGGFIDKFIGDKVMALFTAPDPRESAAAAIKAAATIRSQLASSPGALQDAGRAVGVGIGVNSGEVLLGNIGSEERMDFTAIGDAVNVADRLQTLAGPGEVLVGEATAALAPSLPLERLGPRALKGRAAEVTVFALG